MGGVARRATFIKAVHAEAEHVLLVDVGNSLLREHDPAKRTRGRTSIEAMNLLGYDAAAIGGLDIYVLSAAELRERIQEADFPIVSANAVLAGTDELVAEPYTILDLADHKVGIIGLTDAASGQDLETLDPVLAVRRWLPDVQRSADIIVLLSHAGEDADARVLGQFPEIDVVVSGRDMASDPCAGGSVQADASLGIPSTTFAGDRVGMAFLSFDKSGRLLSRQWADVPLTVSFDPDEAMAAWVQETMAP